MRNRPSKAEWIVLSLGLVVGIILRCWHLERESVEHFDEGVYASVLWYDGMFDTTYPARDFYAPPMLPWLIELSSWIPGAGSRAPFVPSICFGVASIVLFWWLARSWFGTAAGIVAICIVSLSDFHIQYSRMALTDVPALFWITASVATGVSAVDRQSVRRGLLAGVFCGLAWWTKYTGWLPLAIMFSGTTLWFVLQGRKRSDIRLTRTVLSLAAMLFAAVAVFSPWWYHLQSVGGYAAISKNHASYLTAGFGSWLDWLKTWRLNMTEQLTFQLFQDGVFGVISLGLGMLGAAWFRWQAAVGSTWNANANTAAQADSSGVGGSVAGSFFPPRALASRFLFAGIALTVLSLRIRTPLMMACIALGGFAGMYLWPVLQRAWQRRLLGDTSPTAPGALPLRPSDLAVAATTDPGLAFCITLCWFVGLLVATPFYHPYARLFFPLLASIWLATAGGVSWWLESNLSVARRGPEAMVVTGWQYLAQRLVAAMALGAVMASFVQFNENRKLELLPLSEVAEVTGFQDRRSIDQAAEAIANACVGSAKGEFTISRKPLVPIGETIRPDAIRRAMLEGSLESDSTKEDSTEPASDGEHPKADDATDGLANEPAAGLINDVAKPKSQPPSVPSFTPEQRQAEKMAVYVYGEPALLFHLNKAGILAAPVSHLNLRGPNGEPPTVPTFVVIGPHAKRSDSFWDERLSRASQLEDVITVPYDPGSATLLDLFPIKWLREHPEAATQVFEVYRVR
jgi:4-amino-4-deoxy-L-arabinose transferase-like glycosyltransferase